jgi:type I restriction enzyme, S subunit
VPEGLGVVPLKHLINTRKGVAFKSNDFCKEGVSVVKASDIKALKIQDASFFLPEGFQKIYPKAILRKGDIILSTVGSNPGVINSAVGQIGMVSDNISGALLNQNTVIFNSNSRFLNQNYIFFILQTKGYREHLDLHAHGTANQSSLNIADMLNINIPVPPKDEQMAIIKWISKQLTMQSLLKQKVERQIKLLYEKRNSLISSSVTGKIDVRGVGFRPNPPTPFPKGNGE